MSGRIYQCFNGNVSMKDTDNLSIKVRYQRLHNYFECYVCNFTLIKSKTYARTLQITGTNSFYDKSGFLLFAK